MIRAQDVADYFLLKANKDKEPITNLKLQKLLYYAQGIHLAIYKKPLFSETIEAWTFGPVIPDIYHRYKAYRYETIPPNKDFDPDKISKDKRSLLDEIYRVFGQFSAFRLTQISHSDKCWSETKTRCEISHDSMIEELKKYLKKENG